ncbi:MAG: phosphatidate cytidylyltransferase [Desulfoprunum sp.]|nr:phosphatidate cytidylyltransferase [Desulfoprunum sp.]
MKRIVPGILLALCWFLLLFKGSSFLFAAVMIPVAFWGADEYVRMAGSGRFSFVQRIALDILVTLPLILMVPIPGTASLAAGVVLSFSLLALFFFSVYATFADSYELFCRLVFGVVYIGVLGGHLIALRFLPEGGSWLIVLTAITAGSDSGAYYIGRAFGKNKLCPGISPNKTREGAFGGLVTGMVTAVIFARIFLVSPNWASLVFAAVILVGAGIAGDLTESIVKRGTGVKDSGHCLGDHGGILDRIDSLIFAAPVLYYFLILTR